MATAERLSSPSCDSLGSKVVFSSTKYNAETNENSQSTYLLNLSSNQVSLIGKDWSSPLFLGTRFIAHLSSESGSSQVWIHDLTNSKCTKLTDYPVGVANLAYKNGLLVFTAQVFNDGSLEKAAKLNELEENRFDTGVVYDSLFVRHWDTYLHPEKKHNLFTVKLDVKADYVSLASDPINVMANLSLETPVAPHGDPSHFDISPDSKHVIFSSRVPGHDAAWNTNLDIYLAPSDGSSSPQSFSKFNKGADSHPKFSPDSKFIAWLQMQTPQLESDTNRIVVYDVYKKTHKVITSNWDRSPDSLTWLDNDTLIATAQDQGHAKIFQIIVSTGIFKVLVDKHGNSAVSVTPSGQLLFLQNSHTRPSDIWTFDISSNQLNQRTFFNEFKEIQMSAPSEFWFAGHNDEQVMGWVFPPLDTTRPAPLAFLIHGGPEGAWNDDWSYRWNPQSFVGAGYAVVVVNFHGSIGYGDAFTKSILGNWGGAPYEGNEFKFTL